MHLSFPSRPPHRKVGADIVSPRRHRAMAALLKRLVTLETRNAALQARIAELKAENIGLQNIVHAQAVQIQELQTQR